MSETAPVYVPCAAGTDAFAHLRIEKRGDLVHLIGYADVELTPCDARHLALVLLDFSGESVIPALEHRPAADASSGDPIVDAVRARLLERSQVGQRKYGTTLARTDLNTLDWLRHAQEEALDLAVYLERLRMDLSRSVDDGY